MEGHSEDSVKYICSECRQLKAHSKDGVCPECWDCPKVPSRLDKPNGPKQKDWTI